MKKIELDSSVINNGKQPDKKSMETAVNSGADSETAKILTKDISGKITPKKPSKLKQSIQNAIEKFKSQPLAVKIAGTGVICMLILGIGGFFIYRMVILEGRGDDIVIPDRIQAEISSAIVFTSSIIAPEPTPPKDTPNPINGELYTQKEFEEMKKRYPIAVMVENHIDARPQSGYNEADLVFETLAEGGITRTMPIYWGKSSTEIGPIRSARQYFIEWLMPFDPLYMHIGYASSSTEPRVDARGSIYEYGIKTMDRSGTFWRSSERFAPHNAYTSTELLYQKAEQFGYSGEPGDIESWKFKRDAAPDKRGSGEDVEITFFERLSNGGSYNITWRYDKERNVYLRYNYDNPYTDVNTDSQVFAKNVIIQRCEMISTFDEKAHIIITTIGEGDAIILRDGVVINATWKKGDIYSRTRFYDTEGKEVEFNRGVTWIEGVPIDQGSVEI